jgi:hypothetical protein
MVDLESSGVVDLDIQRAPSRCDGVAERGKGVFPDGAGKTESHEEEADGASSASHGGPIPRTCERLNGKDAVRK